MPTAFTERLLIVVKTAAKPTAEQYALVADPTTTGETFTARLMQVGDASRAVVAYWTSWQMMPEQRQRLIDEFGRSAVNFKVYAKGDNVPGWAQATYWLFEGAEGTGWTAREVLTALGLTPYTVSG